MKYETTPDGLLLLEVTHCGFDIEFSEGLRVTVSCMSEDPDGLLCHLHLPDFPACSFSRVSGENLDDALEVLGGDICWIMQEQDLPDFSEAQIQFVKQMQSQIKSVIWQIPKTCNFRYSLNGEVYFTYRGAHDPNTQVAAYNLTTNQGSVNEAEETGQAS